MIDNQCSNVSMKHNNMRPELCRQLEHNTPAVHPYGGWMCPQRLDLSNMCNVRRVGVGDGAPDRPMGPSAHCITRSNGALDCSFSGYLARRLCNINAQFLRFRGKVARSVTAAAAAAPSLAPATQRPTTFYLYVQHGSEGTRAPGVYTLTDRHHMLGAYVSTYLCVPVLGVRMLIGGGAGTAAADSAVLRPLVLHGRTHLAAVSHHRKAVLPLLHSPHRTALHTTHSHCLVSPGCTLLALAPCLVWWCSVYRVPAARVTRATRSVSPSYNDRYCTLALLWRTAVRAHTRTLTERRVDRPPLLAPPRHTRNARAQPVSSPRVNARSFVTPHVTVSPTTSAKPTRLHLFIQARRHIRVRARVGGGQATARGACN